MLSNQWKLSKCVFQSEKMASEWQDASFTINPVAGVSNIVHTHTHSHGLSGPLSSQATELNAKVVLLCSISRLCQGCRSFCAQNNTDTHTPPKQWGRATAIPLRHKKWRQNIECVRKLKCDFSWLRCSVYCITIWNVYLHASYFGNSLPFLNFFPQLSEVFSHL